MLGARSLVVPFFFGSPPCTLTQTVQGGAGALGAGSSPPPCCTPGAASSETKKEATVTTTVTVPWAAASSSSPVKCVGLDGDSSSNEDVPHHPGQMQGQCQLSPWISSVLRRRHSTVAHPRRRTGACHSASSYLLRLTQNDSVAGSQAVDSPLRQRVGQVYSHFRESEPVTEDEDRNRRGAKMMPPRPNRLRQKRCRK